MSIHVITVVNVHPEKDPTPAQWRRAKVVILNMDTEFGRRIEDPISYALDKAPRSWRYPTVLRYTIDGEDV